MGARAHIRVPLDPIYVGYPFGWAWNFRRAKRGVLGYVFIRPHWGPEWEKFDSGAVFELRLGVQTNVPGPFCRLTLGR